MKIVKLILLISALLLSQSVAFSATPITMDAVQAVLQSNQSGNMNGTIISVKNFSTLGIGVIGSTNWSGVVNFESSIDGVNYGSHLCVNRATGATVTTAVVNGHFGCPVSGMQLFRARTTGMSVGSVTVTAITSAGTLSNAIGSGSGGSGSIVASSPISGDGSIGSPITCTTCVTASVILTPNKPMIGGGTKVIGVGGTTGNTTEFVTHSGVKTLDACLRFDASGNSVAGACGLITLSSTPVTGQTAQWSSPSSLTAINNTGSGIYVLQTSPVITTPTISNPIVTTGTFTSPAIITPTIAKISNLTSNGFIKTSSGDGTLSVDTGTYLTANQTITISGDMSGSGTTAITLTLGGNTASKLLKLDQFAATTSAELASVLSDESGSSGGFLRAGRAVSTTSPLGGGGALTSDLTLTCTTCVTTARLVSTTTPLAGGGALSADLTITCTTCTTSAAALTNGQLLFGAGSQAMAVGNLSGDIATSGSGVTTLASKYTFRTCMMRFGIDNGDVLVDADIGPQLHGCRLDVAMTVVEIAVYADGGTPNVIVVKRTGTTNTNLLSSALATAASGAIACAKTSAVTGLDGATTCAATLQNNTSIPAGYTIGALSGTAGGTAKRLTVAVTMQPS